jgi:dolichol-phosphate mannosyltransferase
MVVPVLNEAPNLPRLFEAFHAAARRHALTVVLVDDGSSDGTGDHARELAGELDLLVLRHERNEGPGRAFGSAFEQLSSRLDDRDFVLTLEGDNTSRLELVDQMLRRSDEGYDAVLASPYLYGGDIVNTRPLRVLISHLANAFVKEFLGIRGIMTVSSFYRLHTGSLIKRLQASYGPRIVERPGFECMPEMLMKMVNLGATISEVAMVLDTDLRVGQSRMKITKTALGYVACWRRKGAWVRSAI